MSKTQSEQRWSVPVQQADVPATGRHVDLVADAPTRAALARLAGLRSLSRLEASFDLSPYRGDGLQVLGHVRATAGQTCVVTLEPMETELDESVDLRFLPNAGRDHSASGQRSGEAGGEAEGPEPLVNGAVDLGAIATEFLILGIDPYPRRPDAEFEAPPRQEPSANPFSELAGLKTKFGGKDS